MLTDKRFDSYDEMLRLAFSKNLEMSIPPIEEMRLSFRRSARPATLLLRGDDVVGVASVLADGDVGEVHMIGLHPSARGQGLGSLLLARALSELKDLGVRKSKLTVAAENADALRLYEKFGFEVVDQDTCMRWQR